MVKALITGRNQNETGKSIASLQNSVKDRFNIVNALIKEEEDKLFNLNANKNDCASDIENCFQWLKNMINEFPDTGKEVMEENLHISQNISASINEKDAWLNSIMEKTICMAKGLPTEEKDFFEEKVKELKDYYEEIRKQAKDHVSDLHEKTIQKRQVSNILLIMGEIFFEFLLFLNVFNLTS